MSYDIDKLIVKKIQGEITKEELRFLRSWCKEDPAHQVAYEKVVQYWNVKEAYSHSKKRVWEELEKEIKVEEVISKETKTLPKIFNLPLRRVAASVIILISAYIAVQFGILKNKEPENNLVSISMIEKVSPLGSKLNLKLPDGTSVKLNSGSFLKFPERFEENMREVFLEGEAFFDVAHDTSSPFIIHIEQIDTRVLGTSFNVKTDDELVQVVVVTGKVQVTNTDNGDEVILPPNKMATYQISNNELNSTEANSDLLAWKEGVIVFDKSSFVEVEETLGRWFGVEFVNNRKVELPGGFTARYDNQSLKDILESIAYAGKFDFKIEGKRVMIH